MFRTAHPKFSKQQIAISPLGFAFRWVIALIAVACSCSFLASASRVNQWRDFSSFVPGRFPGELQFCLTPLQSCCTFPTALGLHQDLPGKVTSVFTSDFVPVTYWQTATNRLQSRQRVLKQFSWSHRISREILGFGESGMSFMGHAGASSRCFPGAVRRGWSFP